jgi:type IV fimbrial biogenesis protein FimT
MLMKSRRHSRGFSMIELAVTLTLFGILMAAAFPSMSEWLRNLRVRNAAESMQHGLQKARTEALRRNQNVTFWLVSGGDERNVDDSCQLSSASGSWVISQSDPSGQCGTKPAALTVIETHAAGDGGSGVTVAAAAGDATAAQCVRFNGLGQLVDSVVPPADGCRTPKQISTIDLTHASGARQLRVMVSAGGGVRMCDRGVTDTTDPRACP